MKTSRSFIPAAALVLAAVAQPAAATTISTSVIHVAATSHAHAAAPVPQLQASLGSHLLAVIRHILAGDDTIHRG